MSAPPHYQRIAARLRDAAGVAEERGKKWLAEAAEARAIADALEGDTPPDVEALTERAKALFRGERT
jgi:hypothetical protein